jgi:hypothetical protein
MRRTVREIKAMSATIAAGTAIRTRSHFYVWMAGAFVLVAFGGFVPTYWARLAAGTFHAPPVIYIHGTLMFLWTLFFFAQTALVAAGRTLDHRSWGLFGIALFTALMCSVLVGEVAIIRRDEASGMGDAARRFAAVTLMAWPLMAGLFSLAIVYIRKPDVHKRLLIVLMSAMMTPAIARVFLTLLASPGAGPPPPFVSVPPSIVADLFIVAAMSYDWRTRGRPHPAYVWGGLVTLAEQMLVVPVSSTAAWMAFAKAFASLAG